MACDPATLLAQAAPYSSLTQEQLTLLVVGLYAEIAQDGVINDMIASEFTFKDGWALEYFEDYPEGAIVAPDKGYGWSGAGVVTGGSIVTRTGAGNTNPQQKRLAITNGQYGRKFAWGDSWSRLQLIIVWRVNHNATFGPLANFFGVCSGTTNMAGSALCDNFVGVRGPNNGATDATFSVGNRASLFDVNPAYRFASKRAAVSTDRGSGAGTTGRHMSASEGFLSLFMIEMSRPTFANDAASVNYSFGFQRTDATQVQMSLDKDVITDLFISEIATNLVAASTWSLIAASGNAGTLATPYAFDQSTGKLDSFNFTWDQAFPAEIACLGARKVF